MINDKNKNYRSYTRALKIYQITPTHEHVILNYMVNFIAREYRKGWKV